MPASTEQAAKASPAVRPAQFWGPADVVFLAVSVAGLAAGAFPELLLQGDRAAALKHPPALQALMAAQAGFLVLFCPLVLARRRLARGASPALVGDLAASAGEYVMLVIASAPLYAVAAWFADAVVLDVLRGVLYLTAVAAGAWGMSLWIVKGRGGAATAITLAAALVGVGLPVIYYLLAELTEPSAAPGWLFSAGPVTCAFSAAASRAGRSLPAPIWAWLLWPVVAVVLGLGRLVLPPARPGD